jgi:hypothetical protein
MGRLAGSYETWYRPGRLGGAQTARLLQRQPGLPAEVSPLVGRDLEIAAVRERLLVGRVVTLTGPGGCGKIRLALRVAALAADGFEDGARLVELASLADAALVPGRAGPVASRQR